jgi:hypothetical protein
MASFAFLGLGIFIGLNTATQGGFYNHIVTANVNQYSLGRLASMGALYLLTAPILAIFLFLSIRNIRGNETDPFLTWGLLPFTIGALITAFTVGKIGSDINYFLELISVSAIWAAGVWQKKPASRVVPIQLFIHTIWIVAFSMILFQIPLFRIWNRLPEVDTLAQQVKTAASQGPVLSDDHLDLVVLAGQEIYYQPFEFTQLYNGGIWDIRPFINEIVDHHFPLILIHTSHQEERWPSILFDAIQQNYICTTQTGYLVCRP